ncbi:hypothetical protein K503DRAFT_429871 [Rhizopogon vinicolor AM-OR11-026]|uniref:Transmembrane protein n=1 Tax=Rhizopogon vinicolor AM-OR11-026 TaxID=1314800 RepID=A0A1B7MPW3_9AGAM|nr:hypothetical protein K503DRAFT_429871 [Rhizopogon vinicolor AM-OR11-026]
MPAPVAVYVVAAIAGVAAVVAFNEFVFEPHIAPAIERWAEDFLAKRRARRSARGPVPIPASSSRGPGNGDSRTTGADARKTTSAAADDSIELEGLNLDEWRNDVHRNAPGTGMRRRPRVVPDTDEGSLITTIDESFTTLSHTPLAPTHVISNVSSPFTETLSISAPTPVRSCTHSSSSSRTASDDQREGSTIVFFAPPSPSSTAPPSPPFGPILPDTPRTSAAYSSRPFSPVVRTPVRSRAPSTRSSCARDRKRTCKRKRERRRITIRTLPRPALSTRPALPAFPTHGPLITQLRCHEPWEQQW